jgi:hypothetical protein
MLARILPSCVTFVVRREEQRRKGSVSQSIPLQLSLDLLKDLKKPMNFEKTVNLGEPGDADDSDGSEKRKGSDKCEEYRRPFASNKVRV